MAHDRPASDRSTDDRGAWTPSQPLIIVLVLLLAIGAAGAYISISSMDLLGTEREVTTEYERNVVATDDSVVVTVVEAKSGDPVSGATVVPTRGDTPIDAAPELTTGDDGTVEFEFGDGNDAISLDWTSGQDFAEVRFEVQPPDQRFVDQEPNPTLRIQNA